MRRVGSRKLTTATGFSVEFPTIVGVLWCLKDVRCRTVDCLGSRRSSQVLLWDVSLGSSCSMLDIIYRIYHFLKYMCSFLKRETFIWGLVYSSKRLVHCHHGSKHGDMQADKCWRRSWGFCMQIDRQQGERLWDWLEHLKYQTPPPVTCFSHQGLTHSSKATLLICHPLVTVIQVLEPMGAILTENLHS